MATSHIPEAAAARQRFALQFRDMSGLVAQIRAMGDAQMVDLPPPPTEPCCREYTVVDICLAAAAGSLAGAGIALLAFLSI